MWQTVWRHAVCCTYWRHDELFDELTHFLTSWFLMLWQTFWCHDMFLMSCMMNFLTSWHIFDFITNFLTSWRIFHFISNCWCIFDVMTNLLKSWRVFDVMTCFNVMTNLTPCRMFWRHDVFLTSWTFWHHDALLDVMTSLSWEGITCVQRQPLITLLGLYRSIWNYFGHHKDAWSCIQKPFAAPIKDAC